MKIHLFSSDNGMRITWYATVFATGTKWRLLGSFQPPIHSTYTTREGAMRAGLKTLLAMFPEAEIVAHRVKEEPNTKAGA